MTALIWRERGFDYHWIKRKKVLLLFLKIKVQTPKINRKKFWLPKFKKEKSLKVLTFWFGIFPPKWLFSLWPDHHHYPIHPPHKCHQNCWSLFHGQFSFAYSVYSFIHVCFIAGQVVSWRATQFSMENYMYLTHKIVCMQTQT